VGAGGAGELPDAVVDRLVELVTTTEDIFTADEQSGEAS